MENSAESLHSVPTQESLQSTKSGNDNNNNNDDTGNLTQTNSAESFDQTGEFTQQQESSNIMRISKKPIKYLVIDFNLINWSYMNLSMKFSDETYIFKIKVSCQGIDSAFLFFTFTFVVSYFSCFSTYYHFICVISLCIDLFIYSFSSSSSCYYYYCY